ncbi:MAG TPA: cytochrome c [Gemmatimonadales bacterium]|nr:cytochrome c [Gemmatimonadales bacterium]
MLGCPKALLAVLIVLPSAIARAQDGTGLRQGSAADGVFTGEQAARGEVTFAQNCAQCHAKSQFTGPAFLKTWNRRSVYEVFDVIRSIMPLDEPGRLTPQQYADVVAYLLRLNNFPPGATELPADAAALRRITFGQVAASRSTVTGVYSTAQATLGRDLYAAMCQGCHTPASHTGPAFVKVWNGQTVWNLYDFIMGSMPKSEPGILTPQETGQLVAYLLQLNGMPPGTLDLPTDPAALKQIMFETPTR